MKSRRDNRLRGDRRGAASVARDGTFAALLRPLVAAARGGGAASLDYEPLSRLDYAAELAAKAGGLDRFWEHHRLDGAPEPLRPSPRPRRYRTSSKRRIAVHKGKPCLFLGERPGPADLRGFVASPLEATEHAAIYRGLRDILGQPIFRMLVGHLSYAIVRGSYSERALILNIDELSAPIVRKIKLLAKQLQALSGAPLSAFFVYLDPTRSEYHFESRRPEDPVTFKKIFGPDQLSVAVAGCRYRFHPTSFSQVNESMLPEMLVLAREMLSPQPGQHLLDLYCGYGLFSHFLADGYAGVVGVDAEGPSIRAAIANSRSNRSATRKKFIAARIDRDFEGRALRNPAGPEVMLLDPPRSGPLAGVITALGRRNPVKVLHVFCEVDQIPNALGQWRAKGYAVERVVPLDMFPGSTNLEVLILLAPA